MSSLIDMRVWKDFKEGLHCNLVGYIAALKIKSFSEAHFSQTLIFTCFLIDSWNVCKRIECVSNVLQEIGNES